MINLEEKRAFYAHAEREADALGRVISVRRLKPSQFLRIEELTPMLDGVSESVNNDGATVSIPRRALPIIAASVSQIGDIHYTFPRNRGELDAVLDDLDMEGLAAAAAAFARLTPKTEEPEESGAEKAKKSHPTSTHAAR